MTKRERIYVSIAFVILMIGTIIALTRQQANFGDHEKLDKHACILANTNREIIYRSLSIASTDPALSVVTRSKLEYEASLVKKLIKGSSCSER